MLPLVVCTRGILCCIHIAPAWGVYSVHFVSLVFGDTTYSMSSIVPHAFGLTERPPQGNRCRHTKEAETVDSKFKDIYIGRIIQQKVDERGMSYAEFARQIHCARTSLYTIFNSKSIDIERLLLISDVLQYDFIGEVYLAKQKTSDLSLPYIQLPIKNQGIDTSNLPAELIEWLKQHLG